MLSTEQLILIVKDIDDANALDPTIDYDIHGTPHPKELLYGQRMTRTLSEFDPAASPLLQIAVRGHHIERWKSPRSDYPMDRKGYKQWRSQLMLFHAGRVEEIMMTHQATNEECDRVAFLIKKRKLRQDPETQCFEDTICLTFLEHYLDDFARKHSDEKIIDILQKTWNKMSEAGHTSAMAINYSDKGANLVKTALS